MFIVSSSLERLLECIGLLKDGIEVLLDVGRCHGCMHVDLVEGGLQLSSEHSIEEVCSGLRG